MLVIGRIGDELKPVFAHLLHGCADRRKEPAWRIYYPFQGFFDVFLKLTKEPRLRLKALPQLVIVSGSSALPFPEKRLPRNECTKCYRKDTHSMESSRR